MQKNDYKRLARVEAMVDSIRAELTEILQDGYKRACDEQDENAAADFARKIRNKLLSEADWTQVSDAPVDKEAWSAYRQALRDVPEQTGFPFVVEWPVLPN